MLLFSFNRFIKNKIVKIIREWIANKPLKPSIRLDPLIINKKHKQINISAKISIATRLSKNSNPVLFIWIWCDVTSINKIIIIVINLNFGAMLIFKSSARPRTKKDKENDMYSK